MCHKTAGLVANALESTGIATVVIGTMHKPLENVPRAIVTPYVGAPVGPAKDTTVQRDTIVRALHLLTSATGHTVQTVRGHESP